MEGSLKGLGGRIRGMAKGTRGILMETLMREISSRTELLAKVYISGRMEKCMMVNGTEEPKKVTESGKESTETPILASGATLKLRVTEFTSGKTVTNTRANGTTALSMAKALTFSRMAISIQASTDMVSRTATGNTDGTMGAPILEIS